MVDAHGLIVNAIGASTIPEWLNKKDGSCGFVNLMNKFSRLVHRKN